MERGSMNTEAVIVAQQLRLQGGGGQRRPIDLTAHAGEVVEIVGPAGGVRTALLRTVAGRIKPSAGTLRVCGHRLPAEADAVRRQVALAVLPPHVLADQTAQIYDCIADQLVLLDLPRDSDLFDAAAELVGFRAGQHTAVVDLPILQRRLLALALALMVPVRVVVLDGADDDLVPAERDRLWTSFRSVARTNVAVLAGVGEPTELSDRVLTVDSDTTA